MQKINFVFSIENSKILHIFHTNIRKAFSFWKFETLLFGGKSALYFKRMYESNSNVAILHNKRKVLEIEDERKKNTTLEISNVNVFVHWRDREKKPSLSILPRALFPSFFHYLSLWLVTVFHNTNQIHKAPKKNDEVSHKRLFLNLSCLVKVFGGRFWRTRRFHWNEQHHRNRHTQHNIV